MKELKDKQILNAGMLFCLSLQRVNKKERGPRWRVSNVTWQIEEMAVSSVTFSSISMSVSLIVICQILEKAKLMSILSNLGFFKGRKEAVL